MRLIFRGGLLDGFYGFVLIILFAIYRFNVWANLFWLQTHTPKSTQSH